MSIVSPRPIRATHPTTTTTQPSIAHDVDSIAGPSKSTPSPRPPRKSVAFSDYCILIPRAYKCANRGAALEDVPIAVDDSRLFRSLVDPKSEQPFSQSAAGFHGDCDSSTRIVVLLNGYSRAKASWSDGDLPNLQRHMTGAASPEQQVPKEDDYDYFSYAPHRFTSHLIRRTESPQLVTRKSALKRASTAQSKQRLSLAAIKTGLHIKTQQQQQYESPTFTSPTSPIVTPPTPVAAPRPSYRPLRLGSADSDDEEHDDPTPGIMQYGPTPSTIQVDSTSSIIAQEPQLRRITSPQPRPRPRMSSSERVLQRTATTVLSQDGPGPPVVHVDKASLLLGPSDSRWPRKSRRRGDSRLDGLYHDAIQSCPDLVSLPVVYYATEPSVKQPMSSRFSNTTKSDSPKSSPRIGTLSPPSSSTPSTFSNTTKSDSPKSSPRLGTLSPPSASSSTSSSGWFRRRTKRLSDNWVHVTAPDAELSNEPSRSPYPDLYPSPALCGGLGDEPPEAVRLVPLHSDCVCQHCSGRISAGQSTHYVPHWSRGARAKWLADRKQAEMAAALGPNSAGSTADRLTSKVINSADRQELQNTRLNAKSPPPPPDVHSPQSERTSAILDTATKEASSTAHVASGSDTGEASDDLRRILLQSHLEQDVASTAQARAQQPPAVQVDEMDQKKGETRYPSEMGAMTNDQLVAAAQGLEIRPDTTAASGLQVPPRWGGSPVSAPSPSSSPIPSLPTSSISPSSSPVPWRSPSPLSSPALHHLTNEVFDYQSSSLAPPGAGGGALPGRVTSPPPVVSPPERRSTPVGVSEEEHIPGLDSSLSAQVDSVIAARQERQRLREAKRRGGARGMMAQLEEAEAEEAESSRLRKPQQQQQQQQQAVQDPTSSTLNRRHSTHGAGVASRPPLRSPSPAIPAMDTQTPTRPHSPFMEKLKGAFRRSSSSKQESSVADQQQQQWQRHHNRSMSYGGQAPIHRSNSPLARTDQTVTTTMRPIPHRQPIRSRSDGAER